MPRLIPCFILTTCLAVGLTGCGPLIKDRLAEPAAPGPSVSAPEADGQLRIGGGYRGSDDPCRRVGQNDFTAPMLREDADLVGCPIEFDGRPAFQKGTGGREVARTGAWVLYTVPLLSDSAPVADG